MPRALSLNSMSKMWEMTWYPDNYDKDNHYTAVCAVRALCA